MSAEQESGPPPPSETPADWAGETVTDLIDRMDREAFRRALEQREPRRLQEPKHR